MVAVDESGDMVQLVRHAQPVRSAIEELDLARSFDAVLLSHLINAADAELFLAAAARHLPDDGLLLAQRLEPGRLWQPGYGSGRAGERRPGRGRCRRRPGPGNNPLRR